MGSSSDFQIFYDSPLPLQEYFEIIDQHFEVWTDLLFDLLQHNNSHSDIYFTVVLALRVIF